MSYSSVEPTVIDIDIVKRALNDLIDPDIAELAKRKGAIDYEEVYHLRLDYKNILKIDNLWIYENITKLQLDNNIIEKIENIHFMANLEWLDLSFNNITVIEGLDTLVKLTDLTLFNNRISKLENLDALINLEVLSVGNNDVKNLENVSYLMRFESLRVLHCQGNAICRNEDYKSYCLAHLKSLKYLDYRLIDQESIQIARAKFIDSIIALEEEEKAINSKRGERRIQDEIDIIHNQAHILQIDSLFDKMFDDAEFTKLVPIAPVLIIELREEYRGKVDAVVKELKTFVLKKSDEKEQEKWMIEECLRLTKEASDKQCLEKLDIYYHRKKELTKVVQQGRLIKEVNEAIKELNDSTQILSNFLMAAEMAVVEQFEDVLKEFERNYTEQCNAISECGQIAFGRLRELESQHFEKFTETVMVLYDKFNKGDIDDVEDDIRDLLGDKELLINAVNVAHDSRSSKQDAQEELLTAGCSKDLDGVVKKVYRDEVMRNRNRVAEIVSFLSKCQRDIESTE